MFLVFSAIAAILCVMVILQEISYERSMKQKSEEIILRVDAQERELDTRYAQMKQELQTINQTLNNKR